jgi:hypothetical protein
MHDCKAIRKQLIELALDETPSDQSEPLLDELARCHPCREEYASIRSVLRVTDQAMQAALPSENFWSGYHARLRQSVRNNSESGDFWLARPRAKTNRPPRLRNFLQRLATASVPVPVPVAAIVIVLFGLSIVFAMQSRPLTLVPVTGTSPVTRTVEVPVIRDRVVTRVVYRDRSQRPTSDIARTAKTKRMESKVTDRQNDLANTPISLVGFKPTSDPKLTIIKGSYRDEK